MTHAIQTIILKIVHAFHENLNCNFIDRELKLLTS